MIVILTGAPGAGKGTQADLLADRLGFKKISTGDALRRHIRDGSEIGKQAGSLMAEGKLVPDHILLGILNSELDRVKGMPVLLDGYPRNVEQAKALQALTGIGGVGAVIHLDVDPKILIGRISGRRTCSNCGASYHIESNPSKSTCCDRCGGELIQRPDDNADKVRVRLEVYETETKPILKFYNELGLCTTVDGSKGTEDVYQALATCLRQFA